MRKIPNDYVLSVEITGDSSSLESAVKKANDAVKGMQKSLSSISSSLKSAGDSLTSFGRTATAATVAVSGIAGATINVGKDFEAQMSRVQAISGATGDELEALRDQAIELGADTAFSAKEAAEGMENLAAAGFTTTEIMDAMPGLLDLAAASGEDLATASDIASSSLRGFGLEASEAAHVADVLAENANRTNSSVTETGEAMKYIAPLAQAAGISIEETAAAIGIMANAGIQGSQAGTTLRGALSRLSKPTAEMTSVMDELGISFYNSNGTMKSLSEQVAMLETALAGMTDEQRNAALVTLYGQESLSGMLALINEGSGSLAELTTEFQNCDGAAAAAAKVMQDNLSGAIEEFKGSVETLGILVYDEISEPLKEATQRATEFVNKISEGFKANGIQGVVDEIKSINPVLDSVITKAQEVVDFFNNMGISPGALLGIAAAIGPVSLALGKILTMSSGVLSFFSGLFGVVGKVGTVFLGLSTPLQIVVVAIGALATAFGYLMTSNDEFRESVIATAETIISSVQPILQTLGEALTTIGQTLGESITGLLQQIAPLLSEIVLQIGALFETASPLIAALIDQLVPVIQTIIDTVTQILSTLLPPLLEIISQVILAIQQILPPVASVLEAVIGAISSILEALAPIVEFIAQLIADIITKITPIISFVAEVISTVMNIIAPIIDFIGEVIAGIIDIISGIISAVSDIFDSVVSTVEGAWDAISSAASSVFSGIKNLWSGLTSFFSNLWNGIKTTTSNVFNGIKNVISNVFKAIQNAWNGLTSFVGGIFDGISSGVSALVSTVKSVINGVIGAINGAIWVINLIPGVNIGSIPYLAHGTDDWQGGFARMNEGGRGELTYLPNGAQVIPHDISVKYAKESARANASAEPIDLSGVMEGMVIQVINNTSVDGTPLKETVSDFTIRKIGNQQRAVQRSRGIAYV